jgi:integral membrane protein (TIGR00529 family)
VKDVQDFLAVIVSFLVIPVFSKRKIPVGIAICICAFIMAVLGGLGIAGFGNAVAATFFNFDKVQQLVVIAEISIIGVLIRKYKIIDKVLEYLSEIINSRRLILMFIPAMPGMLSVPGGAMMSAPLIDQLGEKSNLSKPHRAIINLIFRHISMFIMPYTTGYLLVMSLAPEVSLYKLIGLNSIFVVIYVIIGYYLYVRKVKEDTASPNSFKWENLIGLLKYTAPLYVAVLLNLLLGIPFYIGMLANLLVLFLLHPTKMFPIDAVRAFNLNVLYALIGVYSIQGVIGQMESINTFLTFTFGNPNTVMLGIIAISLFLGTTTGFQPAALGVLLPIIVALPLSENMMLLYCYFTFIWSFIGYFFSPLHLCQLFTCEYMKVSMIDLYKEYWKFFISLSAVVFANYFVVKLLVK